MFNQFTEYVANASGWAYAAIFLLAMLDAILPVVPSETAVITAGVVAASGHLFLPLIVISAMVGAMAGDNLAYLIGWRFGEPATRRFFSSEKSRLLNKKHLMRAHEFYETYGGLTIILARFMPIVRTFAPFVAGIGKMSYPRFAVYNVAGGAVWVLSFLIAGWWFGGLETVQKNFHLVIGAIIVISVLPPIIEALRLRLGGPRSGSGPHGGSMNAPAPLGDEAIPYEEAAPSEPLA